MKAIYHPPPQDANSQRLFAAVVSKAAITPPEILLISRWRQGWNSIPKSESFTNQKNPSFALNLPRRLRFRSDAIYRNLDGEREPVFVCTPAATAGPRQMIRSKGVNVEHDWVSIQ
jgi:hypothetical protein